MKTISSETEMKDFGAQLGAQLRGGEVIQLIGDVGAGKTTLVKGIAKGLAVDDEVQSPSFTLSRVYEARDNLRLVHYDFYRLTDAGIMALEVAEDIQDPQTITIIEWADVIAGILPEQHTTITITSPSETSRELVIEGDL